MAGPLCMMHKCINALLSLTTTDFVSGPLPPYVPTSLVEQAIDNVSLQDFAACPADNFSLSLPPSFPYGRHIRTIMRTFKTATHWNTNNPCFEICLKFKNAIFDGFDIAPWCYKWIYGWEGNGLDEKEVVVLVSGKISIRAKKSWPTPNHPLTDWGEAEDRIHRKHEDYHNCAKTDDISFEAFAIAVKSDDTAERRDCEAGPIENDGCARRKRL